VTLMVWLGSIACAPNGNAATQISAQRRRECDDMCKDMGGLVGPAGTRL
jgi:hypothetical protein